MDEFCIRCKKLLNDDNMYFDFNTNERIYLCDHCWEKELLI